MLYMYDDIDSRAAAMEARARQMRYKEAIRLFRLAVSALARGARRLARINGAHAVFTGKDRARSIG